ncbi:hypothetical protein ACQ86B_29065 (plasmid) [Mycolicibacterium aichiense]|uniref:hypothetical protein n=1 Tax=Mycolicibacterium aichiense TaxID=1799 RepID=UPI003D672AA2
MMTLLQHAYHMLEVSSVMSPLSKQWSRGGAARDFWQYRRARPLSESIPLGPEARKALVTGWFTARLLGTATATDDQGHIGLTVHVDGKPHTLPKRGVRPPSRMDPVGLLLEGLAVAMVGCFEKKNLDDLLPYGRLIELGSEVDKEQDNPVVAWVRGAGGQAADLAKDLSGGASRREAATGLIKRWRAAADQMPDKMSGDIADAQSHSTYEVYADLLEALDRIQAAVNRDDDEETIPG